MGKYICKQCGAELTWNKNSSSFKCEFCDSSYQVSDFEDIVIQEEIQEIEIQECEIQEESCFQVEEDKIINTTKNETTKDKTTNKKSEKRKKKEKKKKIKKKKKFKGIFFLLILLVAGFFIWQNHSAKVFLNSIAPDVPFQYSGELDYQGYVTGDIIIPNEIAINDEERYPVEWESSNPNIINIDGTVNRPENSNKEIVLTLKLKKGLGKAEKDYSLTVIKEGLTSSDDIFVVTEEIINSGINANDLLITYAEDGSIHSIDGNFNNTKVESEKDALEVINKYRTLLNIPEDIIFKIDKIQDSLLGTNYSFVAISNNVKVLGEVITIGTKDGYLNSITSTISNNTNIDNIEISEDELLKIVSNKTGWEKPIIVSSEKYISNNLLVYKIITTTEETNNNVDIYEMSINAKTKEIINFKSLIQPFGEQIATGTGKNEKGVEYTFNTTKTLRDGYLFKDISRKITIAEGTTTNVILASTLKNPIDLSNTTNNWDKHPQGVSSMVNLSTIYDWYKNNFNRISFDGKGKEIICLINIEKALPDKVDNAGYVNVLEYFIAGSGKEVFKYSPCIDLDVMGHEFTHGVFASTAYNYSEPTLMTQSINEGYADIFGCLIERNWIIGEDLMINFAATRDATETVDSLPLKYPTEYFGENWSNHDPHINGILLSKAAYRMTQVGFSNDDVAKIWYQSMYYGYDDSSDFLTVRSNVERAANALGYSEEEINKIGDIFGELKIGEMVTKKIEGQNVEGDVLKDNTTKRDYILLFSPVGTITANAPVYLFEEDVYNGKANITDEQMSEILSYYLNKEINKLDDSKEWNIEVKYKRYSPTAIKAISLFIDEKKTEMLNNFSTIENIDTSDISSILDLAFVSGKFNYTPYEFYNRIFEMDYSKITINEDNTITYND